MIQNSIKKEGRPSFFILYCQYPQSVNFFADILFWGDVMIYQNFPFSFYDFMCIMVFVNLCPKCKYGNAYQLKPEGY